MTAGADGWTEARFIDELHRRYGASSRGADRFVRAEHVPAGVGLAAAKARIVDFLAQDCLQSLLRRDGRPASGRYVTAQDGRWVLDPSILRRRVLHGHEIKVSRSDWLKELRDPTKAQAWMRYCDRWWLVAPASVVRPGELPAQWGLLVPSHSGLCVSVQAPLLDPDPMAPDVRTAVMRAVATTAERRAMAQGGPTSATQSRGRGTARR